jgi:hypothetical protein
MIFLNVDAVVAVGLLGVIVADLDFYIGLICYDDSALSTLQKFLRLF